MKRRDLVFATGALGVLVVAPVFAQSPKAPRRIAWLVHASRENFKVQADAFGAKLKELGYVEGRDYVFEKRHSELPLAETVRSYGSDATPPLRTPSELSCR